MTSERKTQNRVIQFFQLVLGYEYLGSYQDRENNSNVEQELLTQHLEKNYSATLAKKAIATFMRVAENQTSSLYEVNKEVYEILKYGVKVKEEAGEHKQTVYLIDWQNPSANTFYVAEEVTIDGHHTKRPDIVVYINGIAIAVIELKRGSVSVEKGIQQNLDNQKEVFIERFFTTMQLVIAGNDSQGARYGTILTPEKYYLKWKEEDDTYHEYLLDKHVSQLFDKERIVELMRNFILFDGGVKKICRPHQYFGVKATQEFVRKRQGGVLWHTQGSGKSLSMVWLANWIRSTIDNSRVLVITDRTELDKQIVRVFGDAGEKMKRAKNGADLIQRLNKHEDPLLCTLVHKFGNKDDGDYDGFIEEMRKLPSDFEAKGDIYVFVDECHRTQSGTLHDAMKTILPNAVFIGFTGTPLLQKDKKKSIEVFGQYIHTYKFDEAVADKVVLDLQYEARDIEQRITDQTSIDEWFDNETRGLGDVAKAELKQRWGTMQKVLSSRSRLEKIAFDIVKDFRVKDRLSNGLGNALLVSGSVYQACQFYQIFQNLGFDKCAIVTSYNGHHSTIKGEETGEGDTENITKYKVYQDMLGGKDTEAFEEEVKEKFIKHPGQMKLLIVVDKLLTGFDAPSATYLYIDKKMQDHGLFQAICRVNRLDDESKEYGYIVDYKDLFRSLESSIDSYTSEAFDSFDEDDVKGLLKDRLETARNNLDTALEAVIALCEPVFPREDNEFRKFFCGDPENPDDLKEREELRTSFYKLTAKMIRAYANAANEMKELGYSLSEAEEIKTQVKFYTNLRDYIKLTSNEYVDLKRFEPGMRQLIDMYISADASKRVSALEDMTLVELIVERGEDAIDELPPSIRKNKQAVAETIENNLRKVIIEERLTNPKYYDRMSELLDDIIQQRKEDASAYAKYLEKIVELTKMVKNKGERSNYPTNIYSQAQRALYDNLDQDVELTIAMDKAVKYSRTDSWKGHKLKEKAVEIAIKKVLPPKYEVVAIFDIIKNQDEY